MCKNGVVDNIDKFSRFTRCAATHLTCFPHIVNILDTIFSITCDVFTFFCLLFLVGECLHMCDSSILLQNVLFVSALMAVHNY